jgi:diguanylate cyclase (GGDEF)-like protein
MWILDGKPGDPIRALYYVVTACYYVLNPLICMFWSFYADYHIYKSEKRLKKILIPMLVPTGVNLILSFLSIANDKLLFYLDENNVYHRGQYFPVLAVLCFLYILHTGFYVIHNRQRIHRQFYRSLLLFSVPPVIGALIQFAFYGIPLIWIGMTISIVIIFIRIQNEQMYKDYLTGLFNRRQLDLYLQEVIQKSRNQVAGIMLDLNSFKNINDYYGHSTGDEALKYASQLLKKSFSQHCFISRFGGDEFVVLLEIKDKYDLENNLREFKENVLPLMKNIRQHSTSRNIFHNQIVNPDKFCPKEILHS